MKLKEDVDEGTYRKIQELRIKEFTEILSTRGYTQIEILLHILGFVNKEDVAAAA